MLKCPICDGEQEWDKDDKHFFITERRDGHVHVHGDFKDKTHTRNLIETAAEEVGVVLSKGTLKQKEIVFHNRQRIGDMLMFTCAIRDFKAAFPEARVNVISTAAHIWDHNPNIDRKLKATPENTIKIGPGKLTNSSNRIDWHFANAYRVSIEDALRIHIPQGESRPDIYLTEEEYNAPRIDPRPYWIICITGEKGWGCKMYPADRWQKFIDLNPDTLFYQIGAIKDDPPRLKGPNVVDFVGKTQSGETGVRDLFKLFLNAEGSIGLVSFHMHLSGALYKPAIVVAGAREPVHFTRYEGHRYLSTDGCLPCATSACWHCNVLTCSALKKYNDLKLDPALRAKILRQDGLKEEEKKKPENIITKEELAEFYRITRDWVPSCVDMIHPEDLTRALQSYYIGGRLKKDTPSAKPKLKGHVVPTPAPLFVEKPNTYDMTFGGGSLTEKDWEFMHDAILDHQIKTILEFGAGLSTLLLNDLPGVKVITYETDQKWINRIHAIKPQADVRLWDGQTIPMTPDKPTYDLVFVDGPAGDKPRENSTAIAADLGKIVIVHDAGREWAKKYQQEYIAGKFKGPEKGGNRCHLWEKTQIQPIPAPEKPIVEPNRDFTDTLEAEGHLCCADYANEKTIKIVSTARGWGGCARSVTTIMDFLIKAGHRVEFIPFRNRVSSREFQEWLTAHPDVIVTENYSTINERCDVLLMYADDYIWEFGSTDIIQAFSDIGAEKKIMMLNYRRGKVGEVDWTKGWDKYMFLNTTQESELKELLPGINTKVLPPCTDLTDFFKIEHSYNHGVRIVRHSSQGDTKFAKDFKNEVDEILAARQDATINLMPGPSFVNQEDRLIKTPRGIGLDVVNFLSMGNLFWYSLPQGYMDMGPRVILEAMAAGLPVMADNWGGALDRVTPETGWLVKDKHEYAKIVKSLTPEELEAKGRAARERAQKEFSAERWLEEILI